jgi:hypothetical protein
MSASAQPIPETGAETSQVVPALMLAAIVALTGFESVLIFATPGKVAARPVGHPVQVASRH